MLNKSKLTDACHKFKIRGIPVIGNTNNGMIIGLDSDGETLVTKLQESVDVDLDALTDGQRALYQALSDNNYLVNGESIASQKRIIKATLHVTSRCNLQCEGCYSFEDSRNAKQDLSLDQMKKILNNVTANGLDKLSISGGEPFMYSDLIEVLKYAKEDLGIKNILCTSNGYASINTYLDAWQYLDMLSFSLDGFDDETSTIRPNSEFASIFGKMIYLKKQGVNVEITFTLHKKNLKFYNEMKSFADSFEIPHHFSLLSVVEFGDCNSELVLDENDINEMIAFANSNKTVTDEKALKCSVSCGLGYKIISIAADGGIYPCIMFNGYSDFLMGNALESSIADVIFNHDNKFLNLTVNDIENCKDCHVKYLCGGGYRFRGYAVAGDILHPDKKLCKGCINNIEVAINHLVGH